MLSIVNSRPDPIQAPLHTNPNREELLFQLALTKPAAERAVFLDRECGADAALRARLNALLAAHGQPETLLATQADASRPAIKLEFADAPDEAVGQTLGRYKLLERVGEGGCGVVYVAEQTEPVRRRVAIKVIKLGMDTRQVVARFGERWSQSTDFHGELVLARIPKLNRAARKERGLQAASTSLSPAVPERTKPCGQ